MTGERVHLARLRREDLPQIIGPFANLELTTYLRGHGWTASEAEQTEWIEASIKNPKDVVIFGIYNFSEMLIGALDLGEINHQHGTAILGVALYEPEHWGGGYGTEAVRLICQYGAFHLGLHNIMLKVFGFNERAIRAYEKVGFREIGRRREAVRLGQERFDEVYMDLLTSTLDVSALRRQIRQLPELT